MHQHAPAAFVDGQYRRTAGRVAGPAQQGLDAGDQFARAEGFADVIVRARLQAEQAVQAARAAGPARAPRAIEPGSAPER